MDKRIFSIFILFLLFITCSGLYYIIMLQCVRDHAINSKANQLSRIENIETLTLSANIFNCLEIEQISENVQEITYDDMRFDIYKKLLNADDTVTLWVVNYSCITTQLLNSPHSN